MDFFVGGDERNIEVPRQRHDDAVRRILVKCARQSGRGDSYVVVQGYEPDSLDVALRDYQLDGYRWLARLSRWGVGGVLADDMGWTQPGFNGGN